MLKRKRIKLIKNGAVKYIKKHYVKPVPKKKENPDIRYSLKQNDDIKYSFKSSPEDDFIDEIVTDRDDHYDASAVDELLNQSIMGKPEQANCLSNFVNRTFSDTFINLINLSGCKDSEIYNRARIDRRLYSRIISNKDYKPSKDTCIALCFGLKLALPIAVDLLSRAGYVLSHSIRRDVIIEYLLNQDVKDVTEVNDILEFFGEKPLGK